MLGNVLRPTFFTFPSPVGDDGNGNGKNWNGVYGENKFKASSGSLKDVNMLSKSCSGFFGGVVEFEELSPNFEWEYRGEGNANIVLALKDSRVLRLTKSLRGALNPPKTSSPGRIRGKGGLRHGQEEAHKRRVEREVAFANHVFIPLLGIEYVGHVQAVYVPPEKIRIINEEMEKFRPGYRLHKEVGIPFGTAHRDFARIHPHHSHREDWCVEIKPKQGWWPTHLKPVGRCTYCLNQFLKLGRSKISRRTEYCPLDLFSGKAERMVAAVKALVSNPQNNLRIFRNGRLVYGENLTETLPQLLEDWFTLEGENEKNSSANGNTKKPNYGFLLKNLIYLLCTAVLKPRRLTAPTTPLHFHFERMKGEIGNVLAGQGQDTNTVPASGGKSGCQESGGSGNTLLPAGCILSRILEIQRLADVSGGVERIYNLYRKLCPVHSEWQSCNGRESKRSRFKRERDHCPKRDKDNDSSASSGSDEVFDDEREAGSGLSTPLRREDSESSTSGLSSLSSSSSEDEATILEEGGTSSKTPRDLGHDPDPDNDLCPGRGCASFVGETWLDDLEGLPALCEEDLKALEGYLVAATAKDCSIMVTFSPIRGQRARCRTLSEAERDSCTTLYSPTSPSLSSYEDSDQILEDFGGTFHRVRIGVADLDPKPLSSILNHFQRDKDMLTEVAKFHT